eukprot:scaffold64881_cov69-Phaeocystis_antarctica.AAC.1
MRRQPRPQRVARIPAHRCMQVDQATDGGRQRPCVKLGQRLLGVICERLQPFQSGLQLPPLVWLAHQLAQRVPRGGEVDGTVLLAVLCVRADDLPHGAELAYQRHA